MSWIEYKSHSALSILLRFKREDVKSQSHFLHKEGLLEPAAPSCTGCSKRLWKNNCDWIMCSLSDLDTIMSNVEYIYYLSIFFPQISSTYIMSMHWIWKLHRYLRIFITYYIVKSKCRNTEPKFHPCATGNKFVLNSMWLEFTFLQVMKYIQFITNCNFIHFQILFQYR